METLETSISPDDPQFKANKEHHLALAADLRERLKHAQQGGGPRSRKRQEEQGKLFVRDRIERLLDPGSPFLELSALAACVSFVFRTRFLQWSHNSLSARIQVKQTA